MNIYELMNEAIYCDDLLESAEKLITFTDSAIKEKNNGTIVKHFYERLNEWGLINYAFSGIIDKKKYLVYSGREAKAAYFALSIPPKTTPAKSLHGIKDFALYVVTHYTQPVGKVIDEQTIYRIMDYLDSEFTFSDKVFLRIPIFAILNYTNIDYNSMSLFLEADNFLAQHLFLFHMRSKDRKTTPEAVFFHELGHALCVNYTGNSEAVPTNIVEFLKELCFPTLLSLPIEEQREVLADVLSVGMMYGSPFSEYDPFPQMHDSDKKYFNEIVRKMVQNIPDRNSDP